MNHSFKKSMFHLHNWAANIQRGNKLQLALRKNKWDMRSSDFSNTQLTPGFIHSYLGQPGQCRDIHSFQRWHVQAAPYPTLGKSILACSHISPSFIVYEAGIKKPVSKVLRLGSNLAMDQVLPKCLCFEGYF